MAMGASPPSASGVISTGLCPRRFSSGSSAMKAASSESAPVRWRSSSGVPVASTRPSSMAMSQSKRCASSM